MRSAEFDQDRCLVRVVDDDPTVRASLQFLLSSEGWQSRAWESAEEFLAAGPISAPGCLILDVQLGEMSGLDLQELLAKTDPDLPICFISAHGELNMAVHTMRHGAVDFIPKPLDTDRLLDAVDKSARQHWEQTERRRAKAVLMSRWESLSQREQEIARLVVQGWTNKQIARSLGISDNTVQSHRTACFEKAGVRTSLELAQFLARLEG